MHPVKKTSGDKPEGPVIEARGLQNDGSDNFKGTRKRGAASQSGVWGWNHRKGGLTAKSETALSMTVPNTSSCEEAKTRGSGREKGRPGLESNLKKGGELEIL